MRDPDLLLAYIAGYWGNATSEQRDAVREAVPGLAAALDKLIGRE